LSLVLLDTNQANSEQQAANTNSNSKQQAASSKQQIPSKQNKPKKMTEINYDLLSEIIFTNDNVFNNINIDNAKVVSCLCKTANTNKNIKLSFDRTKAYDYFDKIFDIIIENLMYKRKEEYMEREELNKIYGNGYSITCKLDELMSKLKEENKNVIDGFRELIVLELREYIYNYENCNGECECCDVQYNLDYCDQYYYIVNHYGYYEYYENHTYDPKHYILKPGSIYDFANT
jgi:hypothetical protein